MAEYFTRFPNKYIQGNIQAEFGVSRKFYITYILIDRYRSIEDFSWITIRKVLNFYGYKTTRHKPKAFTEILNVLEYMINNKMIEVVQDLDSISYDTGIEIKIIAENFDQPNKFTKISASQVDAIMMSDSSINKENLLLAFLYIKSYIGCRHKQKQNGMKNINNEDFYEDSPLAFWKPIQTMSTDLGMSKKTIDECLDYLTQDSKNHTALLVKHKTGYIPQSDSQPPKQAPNIYVLNQKGYENEIKWAINKMMQIYNINSFVNENDSKKGKNGDFN